MPAFEGSSNGRVARHGTQSGYVTHQTYKIPHEVCQGACKDAHNRYTLSRRELAREEKAGQGGSDG